MVLSQVKCCLCTGDYNLFKYPRIKPREFMRLSRRIIELYKIHLPAGSLRARMAYGTFWTLVGTMIAQLAGMLGSIFSARILGKVGFGELGMIRSTVLMFGVLAGTGLGMATTKYVAEFRVNDPFKAGRMIGLFMNTAFILGTCVTLNMFDNCNTPSEMDNGSTTVGRCITNRVSITIAEHNQWCSVRSNMWFRGIPDTVSSDCLGWDI